MGYLLEEIHKCNFVVMEMMENGVVSKQAGADAIQRNNELLKMVIKDLKNIIDEA